MLLCDHGAEVTRIEPPGANVFQQNSGYRVWNRGKRSAIFDLKREDDRRLFHNMAAASDVLIESFSPGVTKRLGIDFYNTLHALNLTPIDRSITGYGRDNRYADRPGFDALVAARTGICSGSSGAGPGSPMDRIRDRRVPTRN